MRPDLATRQPEPLIEVLDVRKEFAPVVRGRWGGGRVIRAVDGVSFRIYAGETLGLAGESGSGKSTTAKLLLRLYRPTAGRILYRGVDIGQLRRNALLGFRRRAQMVFQDPYASLSPRMRAQDIVAEPLGIHRVGRNRAERLAMVREMLGAVGLRPVEEFLARFPHELSGGERQRVSLARALVIRPEFLVADEPVSMLDVSIRAGILNLLKDLIARMGLAGLFISHDLALIRYMCDRTAIMYLGRLVEMGPTVEVTGEPQHPYTRALVAASPAVDRVGGQRPSPLRGDIGTQVYPGSGCRFLPRCPVGKPLCRARAPQALEVGPGHYVECHLAGSAGR